MGTCVNITKNIRMDGDGEREGGNKVRRNKTLQENICCI